MDNIIELFIELRELEREIWDSKDWTSKLEQEYENKKEKLNEIIDNLPNPSDMKGDGITDDIKIIQEFLDKTNYFIVPEGDYIIMKRKS